MEPAHPRLDEIDAYWARLWGCDAAALREPGVPVLPAALDEHPLEMQLMRRCAATLVSARHELVEPLRQKVCQLDPAAPVTGRWLAETLGWPALGTAFHAGYRFYLAPDDFIRSTTGARLVTERDRTAVTALLVACDPAELREAELSAELPVLFGVWESRQLSALAGFHLYDDFSSDVRVIVHPAHRRRGLARQAAGALCAWGLADGRIIQYECADWNHSSLAVANGLGFRLYAEVEVIEPVEAAEG